MSISLPATSVDGTLYVPFAMAWRNASTFAVRTSEPSRACAIRLPAGLSVASSALAASELLARDNGLRALPNLSYLCCCINWLPKVYTVYQTHRVLHPL